MKQGREKTTDLTDAAEIERIRKLEGADIKESLEIGREGVAGLENKWPDFDPEGEEFKLTMLEFFEQCKGLHVEVMRAIAVGLGIEQGWFDSFCNGGDNTLRLLHYPEVDAEVFKNNKNSVRAGAHTDYGKSCFEAVAALERRTSTHSAPTTRLHHAPLPGRPRRPTGPQPEQHLHQRDPDPGHHRCQCRRSACAVVE